MEHNKSRNVKFTFDKLKNRKSRENISDTFIKSFLFFAVPLSLVRRKSRRTVQKQKKKRRKNVV